MDHTEAAQIKAEPKDAENCIASLVVDNERPLAARKYCSDAENIKQQITDCRAQGLPCRDSSICPCFYGISSVQ